MYQQLANPHLLVVSALPVQASVVGYRKVCHQTKETIHLIYTGVTGVPTSF